MIRRGQGALEYLMTYGWAILVVMVVGITMWHLGMFNMGSAIPPTSTGFSVMKPLLPTCKMADDVFGYPVAENGFSCQFVNNAPLDVRFKDVNVKVNDVYCSNSFISDSPRRLPGTWFLWVQNNPYSVVFSFEDDGINCYCNPGCIPLNCQQYMYVGVSKSKQFTVGTEEAFAGTNPCSSIAFGEIHTIGITMTYDINIGGIWVTKKDSGTIRLSA